VSKRPAHGDGFSHEAYFYAGEEEFLAGTVPFLEAGIAAGEAVLAVLPEPRLRLLKRELGAAAGTVEFQPMEEVGRNPGRLVSAWRDVLRARDPGKGLRGLGEPAWAGRSAAELDECERHERLINLSFDEEPALTLMCPYDVEALDDEVLAAAQRSHPHCSDAHGQMASPRFAPASPLEGSLPQPVRPGVTLSFGKADLRMVRHVVSQCARSAGLDTRRNEDLVLSVCEVATNSIQHGGGEGSLRVWEEEGTLVCDVRDAGQVENPLVGRERPRPDQVGGRGLWIANQICDLVQIRSGDLGTQVRLRMAITG
jgi:anti-sigma regulatory factor (Ser/Thr protein kinase)